MAGTLGARGGDLSTMDRALDRRRAAQNDALALWNAAQNDAASRMAIRGESQAASIREMMMRQREERDFLLARQAMQEDRRRFDLGRADAESARKAADIAGRRADAMRIAEKAAEKGAYTKPEKAPEKKIRSGGRAWREHRRAEREKRRTGADEGVSMEDMLLQLSEGVKAGKAQAKADEEALYQRGRKDKKADALDELITEAAAKGVTVAPRIVQNADGTTSSVFEIGDVRKALAADVIKKQKQAEADAIANIVMQSLADNPDIDGALAVLPPDYLTPDRVAALRIAANAAKAALARGDRKEAIGYIANAVQRGVPGAAAVPTTDPLAALAGIDKAQQAEFERERAEAEAARQRDLEERKRQEGIAQGRDDRAFAIGASTGTREQLLARAAVLRAMGQTAEADALEGVARTMPQIDPVTGEPVAAAATPGQLPGQPIANTAADPFAVLTGQAQDVVSKAGFFQNTPDVAQSVPKLVAALNALNAKQGLTALDLEKKAVIEAALATLQGQPDLLNMWFGNELGWSGFTPRVYGREGAPIETELDGVLRRFRELGIDY